MSRRHPTVSHLKLESIKRIAILRALQLGDMLCSVPALRAIRQIFPDAEITFIGLPWASDFATRYDNVIDRFIEFPGYPDLPERAYDVDEVARFLDRMRDSRFDLAIQLHGSGSIVNSLVDSFGARCCAVFYNNVETIPSEALAVMYREDLSEVDRLLAMPSALSKAFSSEQVTFDPSLAFPIRESERRAAQQVLQQRKVTGRYVTLHPGARDPARRAAPSAFIQALEALPVELRDDSSIVITGSSFEEDAVAKLQHTIISAGITQRVVDTAALDLPLGVLAAIIERSSFLISNDTGVSHLADALRVPSTIFFTRSDPDRWAPRNRLRHTVVDLRTPADSSITKCLLASV